jgi:hypothetical protein
MTSSAGASTRPAIPNLPKPTSVMVSGHNGKPIIGKNGRPIRIMVGARLPMLRHPEPRLQRRKDRSQAL